MCRIDDGDHATVNSSSFPKARKPHRCSDCDRQIEVGERYRYIFMVSDGYPFSFHLCAHCQVGAAWLARECGGFVLEQIREELEEHAVEYPHTLAELKPICDAMRRKWLDIDGVSLMPIPAEIMVSTS